MPVLPSTAGSTAPAASLVQQLFGPLNGQNQPGAAGFLALAMNLFAQTGTTAQTSPTALGGDATASLPTSTPLQNLPGALPTPEDDAGLARLAQPVDWATRLALLNDGKPLPQALQDFFGTTPQTLADLQAKLDQLDDDDQQIVLGELAALLASVTPLPQPVALGVESGATTSGVESVNNDSRASAPQVTPPPDVTADAHPLDQLSRLVESATPNAGSAHTPLPDARTQANRPDDTGPAARATDTATEVTAPQHAPAAATASLEAAETEAPLVMPATTSSRSGAATADDSRRHIGSNAAPAPGNTTTAAAPQTAAQTPLTSKSAADSKPVTAAEKPDSATGDPANNPNTADGIGTAPPTSSPRTADSANDTRSLSFAEQMARINRHGVHPPVSDQIAVHLSRSLQEGQDRVTIRLHPAELGRIEIKLDMGTDGRVSASFSVDQPATLDLLQRDQKGLERALSDAGLKSDTGSLNFNLRDQGQQQGHQQAMNDNRQGGNADQSGFSLDGATEETTGSAGQLEVTWFMTPDRLDVRV